MSFLVFWGPRPPRAAAAMLRGSQVCSALRWLRQLGLACGHPSAALGLLICCFPLKFVLRPSFYAVLKILSGFIAIKLIRPS
nr:hypothetical protein [Saprospira grandis]